MVVQEPFHIAPFPAHVGFGLALAVVYPFARTPPVELSPPII